MATTSAQPPLAQLPLASQPTMHTPTQTPHTTSTELHRPPERLPGRDVRRRWPSRVLGLLVAAGIVAGLAWGWFAWLAPRQAVADVLTAPATRGDLVITVTDRG